MKSDRGDTKSSGSRVKKFVRNSGGSWESVTYIDGIFEYHKKVNGGTEEKNYTQVDGGVEIRTGSFTGDIGDGIVYHLSDHLNSAALRLDDAGAVIDREEFYPYGDSSLRTFTKKRYRYTGKEKDAESGLYYYGARYYAAWTCQFLTVDAKAKKTVGFSPYAYANNNPIMFNDPTGNEAEGGGDSGGGKSDSSGGNAGSGNGSENLALEPLPAKPNPNELSDSLENLPALGPVNLEDAITPLGTETSSGGQENSSYPNLLPEVVVTAKRPTSTTPQDNTAVSLPPPLDKLKEHREVGRGGTTLTTENPTFEGNNPEVDENAAPSNHTNVDILLDFLGPGTKDGVKGGMVRAFRWVKNGPWQKVKGAGKALKEFVVGAKKQVWDMFSGDAAEAVKQIVEPMLPEEDTVGPNEKTESNNQGTLSPDTTYVNAGNKPDLRNEGLNVWLNDKIITFGGDSTVVIRYKNGKREKLK